MTYRDMDENKVLTENFSFSFGRGRPVNELPRTPVRGAYNVDSPAFCSTRILPGNVVSSSSGGVYILKPPRYNRPSLK